MIVCVCVCECVYVGWMFSGVCMCVWLFSGVCVCVDV